MKLFVVYDDECIYAVKETIEGAREAARQVWRDVAYPDDWEANIGLVDTDDAAPQSWGPPCETLTFDFTDSLDDDDEEGA